MSVKNSDYEKLDSNIDGFFVNSAGEVQLVENMIGVVGASDGPSAYPLTTAKNAPLSTEDLEALKNANQDVTQIKNTRGHGLLYDINGNQVAHKGQLFFRDGKGNFSTLKSLTNKSDFILEEGDQLRLKDYSLKNAGYSSDIGIRLDELLRLASLKTTSFSKGNILQLSRNYETQSNSVSLPTVSLTTDSVIWAIGRATFSGSGILVLKHLESDTELDRVYYNFPRNFVMPAYISWNGTLPSYDTTETTNQQTCDKIVWDTKTKTFKKIYNPSNETLQTHTLVMQSLSGNFTFGYLNMICMEPRIRNSSLIKTDSNIIQGDETSYAVIFEEPYEDVNYSIGIELEQPLQTWYTQKTENGFVINIERGYTGRVTWTTVRTA